MRKLMFGLLGLATLGLGAISAQPVEAQPYYRDYGYGYRPVVERRYVRPRAVISVKSGPPTARIAPTGLTGPCRPIARFARLAGAGSSGGECGPITDGSAVLWRSAARQADPVAGNSAKGAERRPFS